MKPPKDIKRGRMSSEERAEIDRLAMTMKSPTAGKIARRINRHPATVNWYMLMHGLIDRKPGRASAPYTRNGRLVHPYTEQHDARITALRRQELPYREIGEIITKEFGIDRDAHSVQVRMIQLAAAPDEEVAA